MLTRIHHLGIAVRSIAERLPLYQAGLGLPAPHLEEVPGEKVRVAMLRVGESRIELLEPTSEDSVVAAFLRERGEGIHHVCFAVDDIVAALAWVQAKGYRVAGTAPRIGAGGALVAFLHPKSTGGVLIELEQEPPGVSP